MSQEDHLPGGKSVGYISDTLLIVQLKSRLDPTAIGTDKEKEKDPYAIDGYYAEVKMVKSRNSRANRVFTLIYDQDTGFRADLSMIDELKSAGLIAAVRGKGMWKFVNHEDVMFKPSEIGELYKNDANFRQVLFEEYHAFGVNNIYNPGFYKEELDIEMNPDEYKADDDADAIDPTGILPIE